MPPDRASVAQRWYAGRPPLAVHQIQRPYVLSGFGIAQAVYLLWWPRSTQTWACAEKTYVVQFRRNFTSVLYILYTKGTQHKENR